MFVEHDTATPSGGGGTSVDRPSGPTDLPSVLTVLEQVVAVAGRVEPDRLHAEAAVGLAEQFARIERVASAAKLRCGARAAETNVWRDQGDRSAGHWLARLSGTSAAAGTRALGALQALADHESIVKVWASGELSTAQLEILAPAVGDAPELAEDLLEQARRLSVGELRAYCAQVRARSHGENEAERHEELRRRRSLRRRSLDDGMTSLVLTGTVEDIAAIEASVRAFREAAYRAGKASGEQLTPEAVDFDAALLMARFALSSVRPEGASASCDADGSVDDAGDVREGDWDEGSACSLATDDAPPMDSPPMGASPMGAPPMGASPMGASPMGAPPEADDRHREAASSRGPAQEPFPTRAGTNAGEQQTSPSRRWFRKQAPTVSARIDHTGLVRGHARQGEVCEISGIGPAPVVVVEQMIDQGAKVAVAVTDADGQVVRVAHIRRRRRPPPTPGDLPPWWIEATVVVRIREADLGDPACLAGPSYLGGHRDQFVDALERRGVQVDQLIADSRGPTAHQRSALLWRDPTCRVAGCTASGYLEVDHHIEWATTRHTTLSELGRLCAYHHGLRTNEGYVLEPGPGKRTLHPPTRGDPVG